MARRDWILYTIAMALVALPLVELVAPRLRLKQARLVPMLERQADEPPDLGGLFVEKFD